MLTITNPRHPFENFSSSEIDREIPFWTAASKKLPITLTDISFIFQVVRGRQEAEAREVVEVLKEARGLISHGDQEIPDLHARVLVYG